MPRTTLFLLLLASGALANDLEQLRQSFRNSVQALNQRNLDGFLATVHPKSLSFYSCGPTSGKEGKEACRQDWAKFFEYSTEAAFNADNFEVRIVGDTGIVWGNYNATVKGRGGKENTHTGRFTLIYSKIDGKWWVVWQENSPTPPAPPTTPSR